MAAFSSLGVIARGIYSNETDRILNNPGSIDDQRVISIINSLIRYIEIEGIDFGLDTKHIESLEPSVLKKLAGRLEEALEEMAGPKEEDGSSVFRQCIEEKYSAMKADKSVAEEFDPMENLRSLWQTS